MADDIPFDLSKRGEEVQDILDLRKMPTPPTMRVATLFDVSGSIQGLFNNGTVQGIFDQLLAVSLKFDDNGELDVLVFDSVTARGPTATPNDYGTFVKKLLSTRNLHFWGGTAYDPPIRLLISEMFSGAASAEKKGGFLGGMFGKPKAAAGSAELPVFAIMITDGAATDQEAAKRTIMANASRPIYWQMVSIGDQRNVDTNYLSSLARLDNVSWEHFTDPKKVTDTEMFTKLISDKFVGWARQFAPSTQASA